MATAYANQLAAALKAQPPVVLLLWGEDAGAIRQAAQQAVQLYGVDPADPFAADTLTLPDLQQDPAALADRAGTVPFGGGRRLVRVTGISGEERLDSLKPLAEGLATILEQNLRDVLVLVPVPRLLEKSHALVRRIEAAPQGLAVRFFMDRARDLAGWLETEVKAAGATIEPDALGLLTDALGADREIARRELEKLCLYVYPAARITAADVRASVAGAVPADTFRLADAIAGRNPAATDRILHLLIEQGEDLNGAFSAVIRHLQGLATAQQMLRDKKPEAEILQKTGKVRAPKEVQQEFLRQVRGYPPRRLATLSGYALETLTAARAGVLDDTHVLARALLALAA